VREEGGRIASPTSPAPADLRDEDVTQERRDMARKVGFGRRGGEVFKKTLGHKLLTNEE
jgi:hypothetical protein